MDTNVIIAIVALVVIAALLLLGGWWFGKSRKKAIDKSVEDAKAKADERLAQEVQKAETAQEAEEVQEVAAEVPPIASPEEENSASQGQAGQVRQSFWQGIVQHPRQGPSFRVRLGGCRRHPATR